MSNGSGAGGRPCRRAAALAVLVLLAACHRSSSRTPDAGMALPVSGTAGVPALRRHPVVPVAFPLRPAPGGRHLEDQRGVPFLIKGETAWLALANLTEAEQESYLADRAAKGFNLVELMLTNHDYTRAPNPTPPANRRGE